MATILVVDDDDGVRSFLELFFCKGEERSLIFFAKNGEEGLKKFMFLSTVCNLVITDINMPEMNGDEMVREIRNSGHQTPVIFMSGDVLNFQGLADLENVDFVQKPFKIVDLKEKIQKLLAKN